MRKRVYSILLMIVMCMSLCSCCLEHEYTPATCTAPMTCVKCGRTEGEALGHTWEDATCEHPKRCLTCGATEGEALEHNWVKATCMYPMTCTMCGVTIGEVSPHVWVDATCLQPRHCAVCGLTEGGTSGHVWVEANYDAPRTCAVCGTTEGSSLNSYSANGKQTFTYTLSSTAESDYNTITGYNNDIARGTVTVLSYDKFSSDATHSAREGYEWRQVSVRFKMDRPCRVMWGYTDSYVGLNEYAQTDYITFADGTREKVTATQTFSTEIAVPSVTVAPTTEANNNSNANDNNSSSNASTTPGTTPSPTPTPTPTPTPASEPGKYISYVTETVQVPISYKGLIFYVCNADYENDHRADDSFLFMAMD